MLIRGDVVDKQTRNFVVVPHSPLQGGNAVYTADFVSGKLAYEADVNVKVFFLSQWKHFDGDYVVDPTSLLSSKMSKVGDSQEIAGVTFRVIEVNPGNVTVSVLHPSVKGTAILGTTQLNLELISLDGIASIMGRSIIIQLEQQHLFE